MNHWDSVGRWINTLLMFIVGVIGFDTLFRLLDANESNVIVGVVRVLSLMFLVPFVGMFGDQDFVLTALMAILGYAVFVGIALGVLRSLQATRSTRVPGPVAQPEPIRRPAQTPQRPPQRQQTQRAAQPARAATRPPAKPGTTTTATTTKAAAPKSQPKPSTNGQAQEATRPGSTPPDAAPKPASERRPATAPSETANGKKSRATASRGSGRSRSKG